MAAPVASGSFSTRVVVTGQSINREPTLAQSWPALLAAAVKMQVTNISIGGFSWYQLSGNAPSTSVLVAVQRDPWLKLAAKTIIVMEGGLTDYELNRTGVQVYADMGTFVTSARAAAAGTLKVIGCTTLPSGALTSPQSTQLAAGNVLVMADGSGLFDAKLDLAGDSRLSDPTNATYYQGDETHPTVAGAVVIEALVEPVVLAA